MTLSPDGLTGPRVLYIAGYGRSGSTLLDAVLSDLPGAWGGGELCWLFSERADNRLCSCGEPLQACPFWCEVFDRLAVAGFDTTDADAARITLSAQRLGGRLDSGNDVEFRSIWRPVLVAIRETSGAAIIVDSSKSTRTSVRRTALLEKMGEQVSVVHLVRDPRAVMRSVKKGSNRKLESGEAPALLGGGIRGLVSWTVTNLVFEAMPGVPSGRITRLRYEDFIAAPAAAVERLARWIPADASDTIARLEQGGLFSPGHAIAGNRMRRGGGIRLKQSTDEVDTRESAGRLASYFHPLMRKYGYR